MKDPNIALRTALLFAVGAAGWAAQFPMPWPVIVGVVGLLVGFFYDSIAFNNKSRD